MNWVKSQQHSCCRVLQTLFWTILPMLGLTTFSLRAQDNNVHLHGAIVAEPCIIAPGDDEIYLDFNNVVGKYLYLNTRTPGQKFEIRLVECDINLGKSVKITFTGKENITLPGLLAIDASSEASGIAIGLETLDAKPLALNKASDVFSLKKGDTPIELKAYIKGEPEAIVNRTIGYGNFSAVATFNLEYE